MRIRPLNDWVVLQEAESETKTSGGIIIPDIAREKPQWGTVVAAGPGAYRDEKGKGKDKEKKFIPTEVKPGIGCYSRNIWQRSSRLRAKK